MKTVLVMLVFSFAMTASARVVAAGVDTSAELPVLWESPGCQHEKLGSVTVDIGTRVRESTQYERVPVVRLRPAFDKLVSAAAAAGGNAVVLRSHQGVYFTYHGRKSSAPVYIKLRGAVVRLPDDAAQCDLAVVHSDELEQRMRDGTPNNVTAHHAYSGD